MGSNAPRRVEPLPLPVIEPRNRHVFFHSDPCSGLPGQQVFLVCLARDPAYGTWYGQIVRPSGTGGDGVEIRWVNTDALSEQERLPGAAVYNNRT